MVYFWKSQLASSFNSEFEQQYLVYPTNYKVNTAVFGALFARSLWMENHPRQTENFHKFCMI